MTGQPSGNGAGGTHPAAVYLFGAPRLCRAGGPVVALRGRPGKLLALLTLNGGSMHCDTLIRHVWDAEPSSGGRHQLRNLLFRLRRATGLPLVREGECVSLGQHVWCDLNEFLVAAPRVAAGVDPLIDRLRLGLHAQRLWIGEPLEPWRAEPWAMALRRRAHDLQEILWKAVPQSSPAFDAADFARPSPLPPIGPDGREDLTPYRP